MRTKTLLSLTLATLISAATSAEALELGVVGEAVPVFSSRQGCAMDDIPDAPARAYRDGNEVVRLMAAHYRNRFLRGTNLLAVTPDCRIVHAGSGDPDPAALDDKTWLAAFHTIDGWQVIALGHMEYQGHSHPGRCASGDYRGCWRNSIVELRSTDGGDHFLPEGAGGRGRAVATEADPYDGRAARPTGYFGPSNIIAHQGYLWAFIFAEASADQKRGVCLLRAQPGSSPLTWRAFDGEGFTIALDGTGIRNTPKTCFPLPGLTSTVASVVRHEPSGLFLAVEAARRVGAGGRFFTGIWWRSSPDLLHWSAPRLLLETPLLFAHGCERSTIAYPSILDPSAASRTFSDATDRPWLYVVRLSMKDCRPTMERDYCASHLRSRPSRNPRSSCGLGSHGLQSGQALTQQRAAVEMLLDPGSGGGAQTSGQCAVVEKAGDRLCDPGGVAHVPQKSLNTVFGHFSDRLCR